MAGAAAPPEGQARIKALIKSHGIALTGGIGTGKSTVAASVAKAGVPVIDADQLAREVTAPGTPGLAAIASAFGDEVVTTEDSAGYPKGSLNRKRLSALVFNDPARRQELERITHPLIRAALGARLAALGLLQAPRTFVYEASLIYEIKAEGDFRAVWVTWCPPAVQLARVMARDGVDQARAAAVIAAQLSARVKADRADLVINTEGSLATVEAQVREALRGL